MIRLGKKEDIDQILEITTACATHMIDKGIHQWNSEYPSKTAFLKDLDRKELYVFEKNNIIIGTIVLSTFMDDEYLPILWLTSNHQNIYIHRLAIHPEFQGQGLAQQLMNFAEQYALKNKFNSVRLDTFSQNARNNTFYEKRGYQRLGDIYFPKQSKHPFHCYELVLTND